MKRTLILMAFLGLLAPTAFVGCGGEVTEDKKTEKITTPEGTKTLEKTEKETTTPK